MTRLGETFAYVALLAILSAATLAEGRRHAALDRQLPLTPQTLYRTLAKSQVRWQVIDARTSDFDDAHVPGAIPFPGCDRARTPATARERIVASAPTVIVTDSGEPKQAEACLERFTSARLLAGGMTAWSEANLPEDSGDYTPPSATAGGGCL
jgi:3-mercaptopyruvate sulfurtransferase SseA